MKFPLVIKRADGTWARLISDKKRYSLRFSYLFDLGAVTIMTERGFWNKYPDGIISDTFEVKA
jgi:hypothetical protein